MTGKTIWIGSLLCGVQLHSRVPLAVSSKARPGGRVQWRAGEHQLGWTMKIWQDLANACGAGRIISLTEETCSRSQYGTNFVNEAGAGVHLQYKGPSAIWPGSGLHQFRHQFKPQEPPKVPKVDEH
jgi:hypothetical protein